LGQSFNINPNLALNTDAEEARAGHDALTFRSRSRHSLYSPNFVWWVIPTWPLHEKFYLHHPKGIRHYLGDSPTRCGWVYGRYKFDGLIDFI